MCRLAVREAPSAERSGMTRLIQTCRLLSRLLSVAVQVMRRGAPENESDPAAFPLAGPVPSVSTQSAPVGIRTPNLLIRSQMLYPLSYGRPLPNSSATRKDNT